MTTAMLATYDPAVLPGTEANRPDGTRVRYVSAEQYFPALLGEKMNATLVFLNAQTPGRVPGDQLEAVDEAIARAYWDVYLGCLLPSRIRTALRTLTTSPSGQLLLEQIEDARKELFAATTIEDAMDVHASLRLQFLIEGTERALSDVQVATGEMMTDYLLLQRAVAEDIRRAERERMPGEARATVLERLDRNADLVFEKVISLVLRPQRLVDIIPPSRRPDIEDFARRRRQVFREGVLSTLTTTPAG